MLRVHCSHASLVMFWLRFDLALLNFQDLTDSSSGWTELWEHYPTEHEGVGGIIEGVPNQSQVGESTNRRRHRKTASRDLFLVQYKWETQSDKALREMADRELGHYLATGAPSKYLYHQAAPAPLIHLLCYTNLTAAMLVTPISKPAQASTWFHTATYLCWCSCVPSRTAVYPEDFEFCMKVLEMMLSESGTGVRLCWCRGSPHNCMVLKFSQ